MEGEEIIRAYLLEPGDKFKIGRTIFKVRKIENDQIYYYRFNEYTKTRVHNMGYKSREFLILITNKTKQNEHQN